MAEKKLLDFFLAEAEEHIAILEGGFLELEKNPSQVSGLQELFRAAHTLKGSASLVKLNTTREVAHSLEDVLESIRDRRLQISRFVVDWLLHTLDAIKFLISEVVKGNPEKKEIAQEIRDSLKVVLTDKETLKTGDLKKEKPVLEKRRLDRRDKDIGTLSNYVRVHVDNIEQTMNLVGELIILKNYLISETGVVTDLRDEIGYAGNRLLKEIEEFNSRYTYSIPEKVSYVDPLLEDFRELEFDRYDELNLFSRKLNEITDDIIEALKSISDFFERFSIQTRRLDNLSLNLKDLISESRMVETGRLFQRFTRTIRDMAHESGKKVRFIVRGAETRIDRLLYERLFDPLLHIIRNAISHGIEPPEERLRKGKPEEGRIALIAKQESNSVIIDIKDDGRGIDLGTVYRQAVKMGLLQKGTKLTKGQLLNFLFNPGFTTREDVDLTSGRGVGLDVVRQATAEMNGTINVGTVEGKGTIFRIRLPLTLIIVSTIRFKTGGIEFVVPSSLVQELIEVDMEEYDTEKGVISLRERDVSVRDLAAILKIKPLRSSTKTPALLFNLMTGRQIALLVDELTGQEDTVIKPLGRFLEGLKYYAGVSISADGRLMPVINPLGLLELPVGTGIEEQMWPEMVEIESGQNVLIVDDSLSVRKFVSTILQQRGYKVLTATNGLEALNIIDEQPVDMIILDLEMPVMHGYELLRELERRGLSEIVPTVVLTSRASEKHKEKAKSLGARDYLVKPFEEDLLLEIVKKHLKSLHHA